MAGRKNVGGNRTGYNYRCGDTEREANRHTGEAKPHEDTKLAE
jgi:hypothetical protein